jgi:hypothetical protein
VPSLPAPAGARPAATFNMVSPKKACGSLAME